MKELKEKMDSLKNLFQDRLQSLASSKHRGTLGDKLLLTNSLRILS